MSHVFQRYFDKHGHYPRIRLSSGIQKITVEFAPGYVHFHASPPYAADIYITRRAWIQLLKNGRLLVLSRKMTGEHDVVAAQRDAYHFEMQLLQEKRQRKRAEVIDARVAAQKRRFEAARRRARRRGDAS